MSIIGHWINLKTIITIIEEEKSTLLLEIVNSLKGEDKVCFDNFLSEYQNKVYEHCEQEGYAKNIGGGCSHIVGYSLSNALFLKALESCNVQAQI